VAWVLLDIAIGLLALIVLLLVGRSLYKRVRALLRTAGATSRQVAELTPALTVQHPPSR